MPSDQYAERLQLIKKGLSYSPQHQKLQAMLLQATTTPTMPAPPPKNCWISMVAGAAGDSAAEWHLFLGRDARLRGDLATARQQLQTAYELAPDAANPV